jgi:hypothetical protein
MANVPACYIKDKPVDYELEIFAMLGEGFRFGSYHFRPPCLGVWALWEILDSPVIHGSEDAVIGDYLRLLWINDVRQSAVGVVSRWFKAGKPAIGEECELNETVIQWATNLPDGVVEPENMIEIASQLQICYSGYETIPASGGGGGPWIFAGEAFGRICGDSVEHADTLIWHTPMVLHGHVVAQKCAASGNKDIGRPKDPDDIKLQLKLANEREERGELHEWQELDPMAFPLSAAQCKHPNLVARYEALIESKKRGNHGSKN